MWLLPGIWLQAKDLYIDANRKWLDFAGLAIDSGTIVVSLSTVGAYP